MIRCRFVLESVTEQAPSYDGKRLFSPKFTACYAEDPETAKFFEATPHGTLEFGTINEEAAAQLTPGQHYYLDITPVPAEPKGESE